VERHNTFAGQGSVLLDIGGDVGALIVTMPADMVGIEIEIRPLGVHHKQPGEHSHTHTHGHDGGQHHRAHHPHVAVLGRPTANGIAYTAVFPELVEGTYELYEKLGGPVRLKTSVTGGEVQDATWPS
jgi:hypothetical protein